MIPSCCYLLLLYFLIWGSISQQLNLKNLGNFKENLLQTKNEKPKHNRAKTQSKTKTKPQDMKQPLQQVEKHEENQKQEKDLNLQFSGKRPPIQIIIQQTSFLPEISKDYSITQTQIYPRAPTNPTNNPKDSSKPSTQQPHKSEKLNSRQKQENTEQQQKNVEEENQNQQSISKEQKQEVSEGPSEGNEQDENEKSVESQEVPKLEELSETQKQNEQRQGEGQSNEGQQTTEENNNQAEQQQANSNPQVETSNSQRESAQSQNDNEVEMSEGEDDDEPSNQQNSNEEELQDNEQQTQNQGETEEDQEDSEQQTEQPNSQQSQQPPQQPSENQHLQQKTQDISVQKHPSGLLPHQTFQKQNKPNAIFLHQSLITFAPSIPDDYSVTRQEIYPNEEVRSLPPGYFVEKLNAKNQKQKNQQIAPPNGQQQPQQKLEIKDHQFNPLRFDDPKIIEHQPSQKMRKEENQPTNNDEKIIITQVPEHNQPQTTQQVPAEQINEEPIKQQFQLREEEALRQDQPPAQEKSQSPIKEQSSLKQSKYSRKQPINEHYQRPLDPPHLQNDHNTINYPEKKNGDSKELLIKIIFGLIVVLGITSYMCSHSLKEPKNHANLMVDDDETKRLQ